LSGPLFIVQLGADKRQTDGHGATLRTFTY